MADHGIKRTLEGVVDEKTGAVTNYQVVHKKQKTDGSLVALTQEEKRNLLIPADSKEMPRTSALMAPTMCLSGHEGHIYSAKFSPNGLFVGSCSFDKHILLWNTYGECENFALMKGHSLAVLDLQWTRDSDQIVTASADKNGALWDIESGQRLKRFRGHKGVVNSIGVTRRGDALACTGSDDCQALLWDFRVKNSISAFPTDYQITGVCFSDDSSQLFTAGIDDVIRCWDINKGKEIYKLEGHKDSITGISLSPDGKQLLSNSMDNTLKIWDVNPYVSGGRRLKNTCHGLQHDFQQLLLKCAWSSDGRYVSGGSADTFVCVWDAQTSRCLYKLPGHKAAVSEVHFHPLEPIICSAGADKKIFLGELDFEAANAGR
mmetsp:Transcript_50542/g.99014  ORF Transcript_50542/g.99014 Transcript_50542/m.99014 type:complete len:375 (+) Transcript_50542:25-1149(+)|eukprot:CAMPEP_0175141120 /NCGR_PEP_ID=MMETSP0087-20121206/11913_1 /TAXON_ID=136419 /ORGANISM="Unknown Unknown, Strain D1" /LENGTH=374 /DNA_ID=CAMNT_0016424469 /DNA_START=27 /DNA_END=1151 /DNA_ORIENTATION=+